MEPSSHDTVLIACEILRPDLDKLRDEIAPHVKLHYLDQDLHRYPHRMPAILQEAIDQHAADAGRIVMGYGLCSNGVVGIKAPHQPLIIPRIHDCITLYLGSREAYECQFKSCPGTYYLTESWIEHHKDPLGTMQHEYEPKLGREMAEWGMKEEMKHQVRIALVDSGVGDGVPECVRQRAKDNAAFFEKKYEELSGQPDFLKRLLLGPYDNEDDFITVPPGTELSQRMFF